MLGWLRGLFHKKKASQWPVTVREADCGRMIRVTSAESAGISPARRDALFSVQGAGEDGFALCALCDGLGDTQAGRLVAEYMKNLAQNLPGSAGIPDFFRDALDGANQMLRGRAPGSSTALASIAVRDGGLYWAAAGDSFIYIFRENILARISRAGAMTPETQRPIPGSGYIGFTDISDADISLGALPLAPGDTVLLCGCGLGAALGEAGIAAILGEYRENPSGAAESLLRAASAAHPENPNIAGVILLTVGG